jgi:hypothetical protein
MAYAVYRRFLGETINGQPGHWNRVYRDGKPYRIPTLEEAQKIASQFDPEKFAVKIKEVK